jgi:hypothetical protein
MKLTRNIGRIDHVVITVYPKSYRPMIEKLSKLLGVEFMECRREDQNVVASISWEAGLEVTAPIEEHGLVWEHLQRTGEGSVAIVFGVEDIDDAMRRVHESGVQTLPVEINLQGDEPFADLFDVVREVPLEPLHGTQFLLGQIEPRVG